MNREKFNNIFKDSELKNDKIIIQNHLVEAILFVKNNYGFNMLKEIIAVDNKEHGIELNYHLYSVEDNEDLILTINVKNEAESISEVFDSAVADEKEIYDLFGVKFIGNKELKRLYMPESWEGHPLRKDYSQKDERLKWNE